MGYGFKAMVIIRAGKKQYRFGKKKSEKSIKFIHTHTKRMKRAIAFGMENGVSGDEADAERMMCATSYQYND